MTFLRYFDQKNAKHALILVWGTVFGNLVPFGSTTRWKSKLTKKWPKFTYMCFFNHKKPYLTLKVPKKHVRYGLRTYKIFGFFGKNQNLPFRNVDQKMCFWWFFWFFFTTGINLSGFTQVMCRNKRLRHVKPLIQQCPYTLFLPISTKIGCMFLSPPPP
jgi:hypothetical protein